MADAIDDLFRRFGKAFNKADAEEIAACVTDDFEWRLNAGGAPQMLPQAYRQLLANYEDRIKSNDLVLLFVETMDVQMGFLKEGLSDGQVGQRPYEMGYRAMYVLNDLLNGKISAEAALRSGTPSLIAGSAESAKFEVALADYRKVVDRCQLRSS